MWVTSFGLQTSHKGAIRRDNFGWEHRYSARYPHYALIFLVVFLLVLLIIGIFVPEEAVFENPKPLDQVPEKFPKR